MEVQNYANHKRFYYPHHFIFYPVILAGICISFYFWQKENASEFLLLAGIFLLLGWLSFMMRQHYALNNQNRIIRLELRLRYWQLTQQRLEPIEEQLTFSQLASLRFASDEELPALVQRAIKENLSSNEIKKLILNWIPDSMRV